MILILVLTGSFSCQKDNIDMSNIDFGNIDNLYAHNQFEREPENVLCN